MNISFNLEEGISDCAIDFEQSDIENMWNYLKEDRENFEWNILDYLNVNFDNYKEEWFYNDQFEALYNNLKELFNNE